MITSLLRGLTTILVVILGLLLAWLVYAFVRLSIVEELPLKAPVAGHNVQFVNAHDASIAYQTFGPVSDKTIVLVHGTGAWSGTWISNTDAMVKAGYRVVAIDLPPFGFSSVAGKADYSREAQAKRILATVGALNLKTPVLLGHSFGGGPATEAALKMPSAFRSLILVDAAMGTIGNQSQDCTQVTPPGPITRIGVALGVSALGTQPWMSSTLLKQFVTKKEVVTTERTAIYQVPFQRKGFSAGLANWAVQFAFTCETPLSALRSQYANLNLPTSIIWGEQDTVTPLNQGQQLNDLIKGSTLHVLPGLGHIPQIEDVTAFNQMLTRVLQLHNQL